MPTKCRSSWTPPPCCRPRANLYRYLGAGADLVVYSGGKGIRGPQGTGILVGRADLIEAATAQANPAQFLGRGMKVAKEEVIGLVASLAAFVEEDEAAEMETYRALVQPVVDALVELPGLRVSLEHDDTNYLLPQAVIRFTDQWRGPSRDGVLAALERGNPQIYLQTLGGPQEFAVDPLNLTEEEVETVIRRLREELTG